MTKKRLPRPRIQRAFVRWFNENRTHFAVPVNVTKITADGILLRFQDYPDSLSARLSSDELAVHVNWQGKWWDMLILEKAVVHERHEKTRTDSNVCND